MSDVGSIGDVVRRAQQGDTGAFETIYRTNVQAVYAICRRMSGDDDLARELVQDTFVRAWERFTSFRGESSLATWLHRVAVNVALLQLRSRKRESARLVDGDDLNLSSRSPAAQLDAGMDLDTALEKLPRGARTVFVLHDVQGYNHDEISLMTGIAPGTSRSQLWRARRTLMQVLAV